MTVLKQPPPIFFRAVSGGKASQQFAHDGLVRE